MNGSTPASNLIAVICRSSAPFVLETAIISPILISAVVIFEIFPAYRQCRLPAVRHPCRRVRHYPEVSVRQQPEAFPIPGLEAAYRRPVLLPFSVPFPSGNFLSTEAEP